MKTRYILSLFTAATLFGGCADSFLDLENPNKVTINNFWKTEDDLKSAVSSVYNAITDDYNGHYGTINWELMEGRTENFTIRNDVRDRYEISTFLNTFSNGSSSGLYKGAYVGIFRANQVIQYGTAMTIADEIKNPLIAEARFLRGLNYFFLATDFGSVPIPTTVAESSDEYYVAKSPIEDVWKQVITDLEASKSGLPDKWANNQKGRATKSAAMAFLGRSYLYRSEWDKAITELKAIVTDETKFGFGLQPNYAELFDGTHENGVESVFEIQYSLLGGTDIWASNPASKMRCTYVGEECAPGEVGGWFEMYPTKVLLDDFLKETTADGKVDPRATTTLAWNYPGCVYYQRGFDTTWTAPNAIWLRKNQNWWNKNEGDWKSALNEYAIRYADVLLMLAEAYTMKGQITDAAPLVQRVRDRAKLADKLTEMKAYSQEQLMTEIRHQRNLEFAREGLHFYDLRRWGLLSKTFTETKKEGYQNFSTKNEYYPIPENEINNNPKITQNDPWK